MLLILPPQAVNSLKGSFATESLSSLIMTRKPMLGNRISRRPRTTGYANTTRLLGSWPFRSVERLNGVLWLPRHEGKGAWKLYGPDLSGSLAGYMANHRISSCTGRGGDAATPTRDRLWRSPETGYGVLRPLYQATDLRRPGRELPFKLLGVSSVAANRRP